MCLYIAKNGPSLVIIFWNNGKILVSPFYARTCVSAAARVVGRRVLGRAGLGTIQGPQPAGLRPARLTSPGPARSRSCSYRQGAIFALDTTWPVARCR